MSSVTPWFRFQFDSLPAKALLASSSQFSNQLFTQLSTRTAGVGPQAAEGPLRSCIVHFFVMRPNHQECHLISQKNNKQQITTQGQLLKYVPFWNLKNPRDRGGSIGPRVGTDLEREALASPS